MNFIDYYAVLGVARDASQEELQRTFRKLARKFHPDVNKDAGAADRFKSVNEAYEVLKDPDKRGKYDRYGAAWKAVQDGGQPPSDFKGMPFDFGRMNGVEFTWGGPSGFSSFFEMLFGQAAGGPGRAPGGRRGGFRMRGADQEGRIALALEEAAKGGARQVTLLDPATGEAHALDVKIPPGVLPGQHIRLAGQGSHGIGGGPRGDLFLTVEIAAHERFRVEGRDLHVALPVTPWLAALGGEVRLETLDGAVTLRVPHGSSSGRRIRLRGKGLPDPKGAPGDLYAEVRIVVPPELEPRERELFETLARESDFTSEGRRGRTSG